MLHNPAAAERVTLPEGFDKLTNRSLKLLRALLTAVTENPRIKPARLAEEFAEHPDGGRALEALLTQEVHLNDESNWVAELNDTLNAILREALQHRYDELTALAEASETFNDAEKAEYRELPQQIARLKPSTS